jgi:hypothetical protein
MLVAISKLDREQQQKLFAATNVIRQIAES